MNNLTMELLGLKLHDLNTARTQIREGLELQTAAFGRRSTYPPAGPGTGMLANVKNWNGSAWTEVTDLNTAKEDNWYVSWWNCKQQDYNWWLYRSSW